MLRFLRYNLVGALGIFVQLFAVSVLVSGLGVHYLVGAALAIELAVLHNFAWHERWTWADRRGWNEGTSTRRRRASLRVGGRRKAEGGGRTEGVGRKAEGGGRKAEGGTRSSMFFRCLVFHAGNGCVSLLGSLALLPVLVGVLHVHYLVANLATIAATGLLNFLISDRLVFQIGQPPQSENEL
jgi:putative flippase GtrA